MIRLLFSTSILTLTISLLRLFKSESRLGYFWVFASENLFLNGLQFHLLSGNYEQELDGFFSFSTVFCHRLSYIARPIPPNWNLVSVYGYSP